MKLKYFFISLLLILCTKANAQYYYTVDGVKYECSAVPGEAKIYGFSYPYSPRSFVIPKTVLIYTTTCKVIEIKAGAFSGSKLKNITIPNSIKAIGARAFKNSTELINIEIPNSVTKIAENTFEGCSSLTSVIIPSSVTSIADYAFLGCSELKDIVIPKSVEFIGAGVFEGCTNLENIYFYSNPTIGTDAIPSTATCHLILDDNSSADFNTAGANTYADVSYTRAISEGKYGTIILPFAPNAASVENYAFYELVESGDGYMKFEEVVAPAANTPYIYTMRDGKENTAITGGTTTISSTIETPAIDGWQTIGSYSSQSIDTSNGNYYALSATENEINRITESLTVLPYRAYFMSAVASKSVFSIYISGTTGIEEISSNEIDGFENGVIFDLSGRKVAEPRKGNIYIKNGKKIMF